MSEKRARAPRAAAVFAILLTALIAWSCSGDIAPDKAVDRMIRAYGGGEGVARLNSYIGSGFWKQVPLINVAVNYPFDVYQQGGRYKTVMWDVKEGVAGDMRLLLINETDRILWTHSEGFMEFPEWEAAILRYRFPLVIARLLSPGLPVRRDESELHDGRYRLSFQEGDDLLTLVLDDRTWLLQEMHLENLSDTTLIFREFYGDYRRVDGIWFPNRFSATLRGREYYEYLIPVIEIGAEFPDDFFVLSANDTILPPPQPQTTR